MPKILQGGLKGVKASSPITPLYEPQQEENWGEFLTRNIAKTPANLYKQARTGFGLGELIDLGLRKTTPSTPVPENDQFKDIYQYLANFREGQRAAFGGGGQAQKEASAIFPQYMAESKPQDWLMELLSTELPMAFMTGNLSSVGKAAQYGKTALGVYGGSQVGRNIGGDIGEALGDREIGETLGAIGLGHVGGLAARKLAPSKMFPPATSLDEKGIQNEIHDYKNKMTDLDELRKEGYNTSSKLEGSTKGNASNIVNAIKEVENDLYSGVSKPDRILIADNLQSLGSKIRRDTLTLKEAKQFQKNFNDQIYNKNVSNSFKRQMTKIVGSLNDFISQTGSPEHNENWQKAEQATRELKSLKRNEKEFIREKQSDIKESRKEQKAIANNLKDIAVKGISNYGLGGIAGAISYLKHGTTGSGLIALGVHLGSKALKEVKYAKEVFKHHPELLQEYFSAIKSAAKQDIPTVVNNLNRLGKQIEELKEKPVAQSKKVNGGRIVSGGIKAR